MTQYDIMQAVAAKLQERRDIAEATLQKHNDECETANPRFGEIKRALVSVGIQIARTAMSENGSEIVSSLLDKSRDLQQERVQLLKKMGKPENYLTKVFTCPKCDDTGKLLTGRCTCADKLYAELSANMLNATSPLSLCDFVSFDLAYYADETDPVLCTSPREIMSDVLDYARRYSSGFSLASQSLLLWGKPGLGKTHIALSIAGEVLKKGFSVIYLPSHQLFSSLEREKFSRDSEEDTLEAVLEVDLLILDDLGTEFVTAFVQSQLYNIINTRLSTGKPTIVSTNLEDCELREKYPERLVSRLLYSYEDLLFAGKDIRKLKKYT